MRLQTFYVLPWNTLCKKCQISSLAESSFHHRPLYSKWILCKQDNCFFTLRCNSNNRTKPGLSIVQSSKKKKSINYSFVVDTSLWLSLLSSVWSSPWPQKWVMRYRQIWDRTRSFRCHSWMISICWHLTGQSWLSHLTTYAESINELTKHQTRSDERGACLGF